MKNFVQRIASRPKIVAVVMLAVLIVLGLSIARRASLETNLEKYMPASHPAFVASDEAEEMFGITNAILIAIEHPETFFNTETLTKISDITVGLSQTFPEIEEDGVNSLATAVTVKGSGWRRRVEPFYEEAPADQAGLTELQAAVESNAMIAGRMVSSDGRSTLIVAEIGNDAFSSEFYTRLLDFAASYEGPETIYVAGRPVVEGELARLGPRDMARMAPIVILVMTVILLILLRSVRDTIINLIIVLFGALSALGSKALIGIPIYSVDIMMPVMLIAIGVAYGVHLHNAIQRLCLERPDIQRRELVDEVLRLMLRPVVMTALTTAVGFIALMTSQILPVRYFGLFVALGVLVEMALALILFPLSIYLFGPARRRGRTHETEATVGREGETKKREPVALRRRSRILIVSFAILVLGGFGASRVWIDTSFLANFQPDSDIAVTDAFVNEYFGGTSKIHVVFEAEEVDAFKNPEALNLLLEIQRDASTNPRVGNSLGLTDYVGQISRMMHGNDSEYDPIPASRVLINQYLTAYAMLGDPGSLDKVVDEEFRTTNLTLQLKSDSSALIEEIVDTIESYADSLSKLGIQVRYAGSGYKAYVFADLLLQGQILSLVLSFGIVAVLLTLMFRSLLVGLAGTIPIAITAVVNFGAMGLLGIPLSSATALISSIAVGIGVDYAIHLIEYYRTRRLAGDEIAVAARRTVSHTGRAIVFNAITVVGGFAVLLLSAFPPNQQVGGLVALNMVTSAIGTLTTLLVVVVALDRRGLFLRKARKDTKTVS